MRRENNQVNEAAGLALPRVPPGDTCSLRPGDLSFSCNLSPIPGLGLLNHCFTPHHHQKKQINAFKLTIILVIQSVYFKILSQALENHSKPCTLMRPHPSPTLTHHSSTHSLSNTETPAFHVTSHSAHRPPAGLPVGDPDEPHTRTHTHTHLHTRLPSLSLTPSSLPTILVLPTPTHPWRRGTEMQLSLEV